MKVAELLARRQENWQELETAIVTRSEKRRWGKHTSEEVLHFGALYRAASADLALAPS